ncbi:MAG: biopolymer transporter ExbD [Spirochaetes bacterium]|nr:biopolymer transporter ExbD [Spirochaetota bacterium]
MNFIRRKSELPGINIAPLVDIIFLLLIFFMISSNFIKPMLKMELPKAIHEEKKLEKVDIVITADSNHDIYINKSLVKLEDLKNALVDRMAAIGKYDVIFSGDNKIPYELFVQILDISKEAGSTSFSVEHEKRK